MPKTNFIKLAAFAAMLGTIDPAIARGEDLPEKTTSLIVYGDDACPPSSGDEIVVCARRPEGERYRIPKALRKNPEERGEMGWGARAADLDQEGQTMRPGSCSVVGSGGQTGCMNQMIRNWGMERRQMRRDAEQYP